MLGPKERVKSWAPSEGEGPCPWKTSKSLDHADAQLNADRRGGQKKKTYKNKKKQKKKTNRGTRNRFFLQKDRKGTRSGGQ